MQQAIAFLNIRVRQALREVLRAGPVYGTLLVFAVCAVFLFFYFSQVTNKYILYSYTGLLTLLLIVHLQRNDHRFIRLFAVNPFTVFFWEYLVVLFPCLLITFIKTGQLLQVLSIIPLSLICFVKIDVVKSISGKFPVFFTGESNFEWKAGLRKTGWLMLLFWIAALLLTPVPYASIIILWFMLLSVSTFFENHENRSMVEAFEIPERKFLWLKIKMQASIYFAVVLPVLLLSAVFFPENWWISLFFLLYSILNIAVFVVSKYAVWGPGETHRSVTFINTICLLGFFLPFLLPLPLFVLFRNYFKAVNQLKPVLHAYTK